MLQATVNVLALDRGYCVVAIHRSAQINLRVFAFSRTVLLCLHLAASDVRFGVDFYRPHRQWSAQFRTFDTGSQIVDNRRTNPKLRDASRPRLFDAFI
jgi:hypothetical protein